MKLLAQKIIFIFAILLPGLASSYSDFMKAPLSKAPPVFTAWEDPKIVKAKVDKNTVKKTAEIKTDPKYSSFYIQVVASRLRFRSSPSTTSTQNVLRSFRKGEILAVIGETENFFHVRTTTELNGELEYQLGYVYKSNSFFDITDTSAQALAAKKQLNERTQNPIVSTLGGIGGGNLLNPMCGCEHAKCRVTSPFGMRQLRSESKPRMHNGVDFGGPIGTDIHATADGTVTVASSLSGYGKAVYIVHASNLMNNSGNTISTKGFESRYGHLNKIKVTVGQRVKKGQKIGELGNTGRSEGAHLHYEIRVEKKAVNPETLFAANQMVRGARPPAVCSATSVDQSTETRR